MQRKRKNNIHHHHLVGPAARFVFMGRTYNVFLHSFDFKTALDLCKKDGGQLPKLDSAKSAQQFHSLASSTYAGSYYWIGLAGETDPTTWKWSDGSKPNYTNFMPNFMPGNSIAPGAFCAQVVDDGRWMAIRCDYTNVFVCPGEC
jgi:hypothetical protein